jgi:hypothetical protein
MLALVDARNARLVGVRSNAWRGCAEREKKGAEKVSLRRSSRTDW